MAVTDATDRRYKPSEFGGLTTVLRPSLQMGLEISL